MASTLCLLFSFTLLLGRSLGFSCVRDYEPEQPRFCSEFESYSCCTQKDDAEISMAFKELGFNESDALTQPCALIFKSLLCSKCNPNAHFLLNQTTKYGSSMPKFCHGSCEGVFRQCLASSSLKENKESSLLLASFGVFAEQFCASSSHQGVCFDGKEIKTFEEEPLLRTGARQLASSSLNLCLERVHNGAVLNMVPHPASKNYALLADKGGLIQLVQVSPVGSNRKFTVVSKWLDITPRVVNINERGLLGITFHYKFLQNGKFYVSYICDSTKYRDCKGPCACNSKIGCSIGSYGASCYLNTVIAEYRVRNPANVRSRPSVVESKRILTFARPFANHNGGDIFFGKDGYFYISSGDGGNQGDPFGAAQKGRTFLGKILRINVDKNDPGKNYSIPGSNPFKGNSNVFPEIFALGLRNPWRCNVDAKNGNIFCGDVGQNRIEEIDLITKGYNYGWSKYEGTEVFNSKRTITLGNKVQGPLFQYTHYGVYVRGIPQGGNAVIGGILYRASRNKCLQGKYLYNDVGGNFWVGTVYPGTGRKPYTTLVKTKCTKNSPYSCKSSSGSVSFGAAWSWGTDGRSNAYVLSTSGVYRLTDSSRCGITC